jgi:hypothetical protein
MARRWSNPKTGWVRPLVKPEPELMEWAWEERGRRRRVRSKRKKECCFCMGFIIGGWLEITRIKNTVEG